MKNPEKDFQALSTALIFLAPFIAKPPAIIAPTALPTEPSESKGFCAFSLSSFCSTCFVSVLVALSVVVLPFVFSVFGVSAALKETSGLI